MNLADQPRSRVCTRLLRRGEAFFAFTAIALLQASLAAQTLHIRTYTPDDGLPASQIWSIHQDRRGYLWFATSAGLSRFDGSTFTNFSVAEGLPDPLIRTIVEDRQGR